MNLFKTINKALISLTLATFASLGLAETVTMTYIHTDHLGTPVMATNQDGSVKWKQDYQPFGEQVKSTRPTDNNVGFTGHLNDKSNGLTYMQGRWYQPASGRFMALDPVGFDTANVQTFGRYTYGNNNPYKYVDPDGNSPLEVAELIYDIGNLIGAGAAYVEGVITGNVHLAAVAGEGVAEHGANVAISAASSFSPVPGTGKVAKAAVRVSKKVKAKPQDLKFKTKRQALRQAKRDAGIPTSQSHKTHIKEVRTDRLGGKGNDLVFENGKTIQHHKTGHKFKKNPKPQHFNNHPKTNNHYIYDR